MFRCLINFPFRTYQFGKLYDLGVKGSLESFIEEMAPDLFGYLHFDDFLIDQNLCQS